MTADLRKTKEMAKLRGGRHLVVFLFILGFLSEWYHENCAGKRPGQGSWSSLCRLWRRTVGTAASVALPGPASCAVG